MICSKSEQRHKTVPNALLIISHVYVDPLTNNMHPLFITKALCISLEDT
jgi:hypothetical protein